MRMNQHFSHRQPNSCLLILGARTRSIMTFLILWCVILLSTLVFHSERIHSLRLFYTRSNQLSYTTQYQYPTRLYANPVTEAGSKYRDTTEDEAFLWFDEAMVFARAGSGGAGSTAMKFGKARQHMRPTGGSGGDGGSVIFTVDTSTNTLLGFRGRSNYRAENGADGALEYANGLKGADCYVAVPLGTVVTDNSTQQVLGELTEAGQQLVVATGGLGGRGNAALKSKDTSGAGASPPQGGEKRWLKLELKLVADVGLIGVPNAGKSTLLGAITSAKPKIASYAFTTIVPNLGVCEVGGRLADGGTALVIADIPGLVEGAHKGVGLGRGFLRHIERCKIILHLVNGDSYPDCLREFAAINEELRLFSPQLASKPQVVVLNKVDLPHVAEHQDEIVKGLLALMPHTRLLCISAAGRIGTADLVDRTYRFLQKVRSDEEAAAALIAASSSSSSSSSSSMGAMSRRPSSSPSPSLEEIMEETEEIDTDDELTTIIHSDD